MLLLYPNKTTKGYKCFYLLLTSLLRHMNSFSNSYELNHFFENELLFFFFHNYRDTSKDTDISLIHRLSKVLATIKIYIHHPYHYHLCARNALTRFYRLIGYTRSVLVGKGDHHLSYLMIFVWYQHFPTLATYALHRFVVSTRHQHAAFGSWRDIKYLCQFIRTYSDKGEHHSLIDICCDFVNSQLDHDLQIQHIYALPIHSLSISNVAKWIPREHKQFDWLSHKLAIHWTHKNKPFFFYRTTDESYHAAVSKSKRLYRKKIAALNKIIDTTQIKQCARNRRDIIPQHVSRYTQMKQPNLVFGYGTNDVDDRYTCSQHFKEWTDLPSYHNGTHAVTPLPIYHFVKLALKIIHNSSYLTEEDIIYQRTLLHTQWKHLSKSFFSRQCGNAIPIIDASDTMFNIHSECYYSSVGYAILFAQYSNIGNRVLIVGNAPTWVNLDDNTSDFVSMVENIHFAVSSAYCTNANFNLSFHLIANTIRSAGLNPRDIIKLRLVIFSTFSYISNHTLFYDHIASVFSQYSSLTPYIVFWNVAKHTSDTFPCSIHQKNAIMVSGFSPFIFNTMRLTFKRPINNPFHFICKVLNHSHFDILQEYLLLLGV